MDKIISFGHFGIVRIFTLVILGFIAFVEYVRIWMNKVIIEDTRERIVGVTKFGKIWIAVHILVVVIITAVSWLELL